MNVSIRKLGHSKKKFIDFAEGSDEKDINEIISDLKKDPKQISVLRQRETGEEVALVYENKEVIAKKLVTSHLNNISFSLVS